MKKSPEFLGQKKPMDLRHMSKGRDDGRKGQSEPSTHWCAP